MLGAHPDSDGSSIAVVFESVVIRRADVHGIPSIGKGSDAESMRCSGNAVGGSRGTADLMRNAVERALGDRKHDVTVLAQTVFPWKMWLHNFDG